MGSEPVINQYGRRREGIGKMIWFSLRKRNCHWRQEEKRAEWGGWEVREKR